jgi:hypothetical protein
MSELIAMCGINCAECEAYQASQTNDVAALKQVALHWQEAYHLPPLDVKSVTCDGCLPTTRLSGHCYECDIRACGMQRGLPNCAHCDEFESCTKLEKFFQFAPELRPALEKIRSSL